LERRISGAIKESQLDLLRKVDLFSELDDVSLNKVKGIITERKYPAGKIIFLKMNREMQSTSFVTERSRYTR
jgi:hypothetical protein